MKLSKVALDKITDSRSLPKKLADLLKVSKSTMWRYLKDNDDELTKAAALDLIEKETGLSHDEILEREPAEIRA